MLKKETIDTIEKTLGINAGELAKAISDDKEQEVTIPKLVTYTQEEWDAFQAKIEEEKDADRKKKYDEGREVGVKAEVKRIAESQGIELEGSKKTFENFVEEFKKKVLEEAKIEPEKQVEELKTDLQKVREELLQKEETLKEKESEYNSSLTNYKKEQELSKIIPVDKISGIHPDDVPDIVKKNFDFDFYQNKLVVKDKDTGEIVKDKTRQPSDPKEIVFDFLKERKYISENGRGGEDGDPTVGSGKITTMSELEEWCEKKGINVSGAEAQAKLVEITKDNKDFDFNN